MQHINYLELLAIFNALKCFAKKFTSCKIVLKVDNTTAISYINRMGGIQYPKLNNLARNIWQWCEKRDIWIYASYIKSEDNFMADSESRLSFPDTEWELGTKYFKIIVNGHPTIDLFASKCNAKCKRYISWFNDPDSIAIDAFTVSWSDEFIYAFPPFSMILRTLRKIQDDKAKGIIIVPFWPTQPWFPLFKKLLIKDELVFQPSKNLLVSSSRNPHPLADQLFLAAGLLSAKHTV